MFNFKSLLSSNAIQTPCSIPNVSEAKDIQKDSIQQFKENRRLEIERQKEEIMKEVCRNINKIMRRGPEQQYRFEYSHNQYHYETIDYMKSELKKLGYTTNDNYGSVNIDWGK